MCQEILDNPEALQLGGQRRHLTVLFADIIGFTSLSERMDPGDVVAVLNNYFTQMVEVVFEHQGTLDKFLGDGMMVFFGAPLEVPQAASQAVSCALAMHRRLEELRSRGLTIIKGMRIGINTGEAIIGNIGSQKRMDFTIIGDVVNVAARLLEVAKEVDANIVISDATFREVEGKFHTTPAPPIVLRGRQEPTVSHQVVG
jgi:adenylate cyclase